jgi:hypothetical protein
LKWLEMSLGFTKAFNIIAMEVSHATVERLRLVQAQVFVAAIKPSKTRHLAIKLDEDLRFEILDLGEASTAMQVAEALGDAVQCHD